MVDVFDYIRWRGDIRFSQLAPNPVYALIFSSLAYIRFKEYVPESPGNYISLQTAAEKFLADPQAQEKVRAKTDLTLLKALAEAPRFKNVGLCFYRDVFIPEEDTQFAGLTFLLDDGSAFLAFRGTDDTLVGWKEDFNMTFEKTVPAQRLAREYIQEFAESSQTPLWLCGHSKGGNLAVFAGAKCDPLTQDRIIEVFNLDGPGFTEDMMTDPGYLRIVPKIRTYVPQSSVIGMLLEHEEPYTVIKSRQLGPMQHDPYSWEIMAADYVKVEGPSADSRFLDRTFRGWLAGMTTQERNTFFDAVFELLMIEDTSHLKDIIRPQNLMAYFKTLHTDDNMRQVIAAELLNLVESAKKAHFGEKE